VAAISLPTQVCERRTGVSIRHAPRKAVQGAQRGMNGPDGTRLVVTNGGLGLDEPARASRKADRFAAEPASADDGSVNDAVDDSVGKPARVLLSAEGIVGTIGGWERSTRV
jgi:hypothetical protein